MLQWIQRLDYHSEEILHLIDANDSKLTSDALKKQEIKLN